MISILNFKFHFCPITCVQGHWSKHSTGAGIYLLLSTANNSIHVDMNKHIYNKTFNDKNVSMFFFPVQNVCFVNIAQAS